MQVNSHAQTYRQKAAAMWERVVHVSSVHEEEARLGRLFNVLMVISTFITIALTFSFLLMKPLGYIHTSVNLIAAMFPFIFIPFSIFCMILAKQKKVSFAIRLYVWANFIAISIATWVFDGVHSPAWQLYMWTITIAGTLLTPAYALWMTGGVVFNFTLLAVLTYFQIYTTPLTLTGAGDEYLNIVFRMIMFVSTIGILTYLNMKSLCSALQRLRIMMGELTTMNAKLHEENTERKKIEAEREQLILELQDNISKIKTLSGLLPICASCKKIRDDKGYWNQVEKYLHEHTDVQLTHGICPDCANKFISDLRTDPGKHA